MDPRDVCIVGAARTALGAFQGGLASLSATQLGSKAIAGALERARVPLDKVDEVFMGNVCSTGLGQAPATQAALGAGLLNSVPCTGINKVCSSGMKAAMLAELSIKQGLNDIVVAGGMESMTNIPHYMTRSRSGLRIGHGELIDGMIHDGLWDPYNNMHMGGCAELCAAKFGFTREQQDAHAISSHERARQAALSGLTAREIIPVCISRPGGHEIMLDQDEGPTKFDGSKLVKLKTVFKSPGGTVTAGNASPVTDGAAALVLASREAAVRHGLPILAVIKGQGDANQAPEWFTTAPAIAAPKAIHRAGLGLGDIDYWEFNEAFSVVDLANRQLLGLNADKVNVHGGAVALGHPIGASGARILVTLINVLQSRGARYGCAAICNGGGGASSVVVENWNGSQSARL